ncbi:ferritin-like domain-containing protein [Flavobacterium rakeshii]|uniref:Ferritin-like domain-containing protein n=1 Tax=Flavobacterium rakeshii TaxID=1038845 RepID=A0A6N8H891_9FLAO|nr:ferritin-like domain-containing protein [Flavobacterium rakeshii]
MMKKVKVEEVKSNLTNRRSFLRISGLAIAGTGLVIAGCSNDDDGGMTDPPVDNQLPGVRNGVFDLGGGDAGILTYAYALEQLEADFYTRVVNGNNFGSVFSSEEQSVLTDLYRHEVIHREFFRAALTGALNDPDRVLPDLDFDYGGLDFGNRLQVLNTAKTLEDTGVAAYNGAGRYITTPDYLVIAGKIVSVEARHASAIRSLLNPGSADFAGNDVIDANGLDLAQMPSEILAAVGSLGVVQTPFTAQFLP